MNILLIAIGSHGDVHPFVGLGRRLRERGHRVTVVANPHFAELITRNDLAFEGVGTADDYRQAATEPDLWHPIKGTRMVFAWGVAPLIRPVYDLIERTMRSDASGETVIAASSLGLGARLAEEKLGARVAMVHLSPVILRSLHETARYPGVAMPRWMPRWLKGALFALGDRFVIDPGLVPALNAMRSELGLPPIRRVLKEWIHSPRLTIGMFPDWFAPVQPDWPASVRLTGFPLYDERGLDPLSPTLLKFLEDGPAPIAFTPGSAMWVGRPFFQASADACRALGRRGLLLSRHREHIPENLPPGVIHVDYAPFSELLPRCAALVHHGGIGTSSQALAAGIPQLVMPMAHDQMDNADRLRKLGVARVVLPKQYPVRVAAELRALLDSCETHERGRAVAERFVGVDAIGVTCDLIEALGPASRIATPVKRGGKEACLPAL